MRLILMLSMVMFLMFGCNQYRFDVDFYRLVAEHKQVTEETNGSVIQSVLADIQNMREAGLLTPEAEKGAMDLIDRLNLITNQSVTIYEYVWQDVDRYMLDEIMRSEWETK